MMCDTSTWTVHMDRSSITWTGKKKEAKVLEHLQILAKDNSPLKSLGRQALARLIAYNVTVFATTDGRVRCTDWV